MRRKIDMRGQKEREAAEVGAPMIYPLHLYLATIIRVRGLNVEVVRGE
jgi:hypothetical protein